MCVHCHHAPNGDLRPSALLPPLLPTCICRMRSTLLGITTCCLLPVTPQRCRRGTARFRVL